MKNIYNFLQIDITFEYGSDFRLELAWARDSAAFSMTARDLGISDFIFVS